jgi:hypothetical protein
MREKALELAGHIPHPLTVAAFAVLVEVGVLVFALRAKESRISRFEGIVLAAIIIGFGVAPLIASVFLQSRGVYHVRVVLLRPDQSMADVAQVKSSIGELKMVADAWELEVPPQMRPADGKVSFSASVKDEFLNGKSTIVLGQDYYPTATIQLVADTSAMLHGIVVDEGLVAVAGAKVSIDGYPGVAVTDKMGNFVLPAHAGKGQVVEVLAQKGPLVGHASVAAGKVAEVIISRE